MNTPTPQTAAAGWDARRDDRKVLQFVGFRLDETDYAVAITRIREIILPRPITRVPQVPAYIEGMLNLRGSIIPIINLRKRFDLPARPTDEETRMIVATVGDRTVGIIVDAVTQIVRITADQIQPTPMTVSAVDRRHLGGVVQYEDRLLVLLEIEHLIDPDLRDAAPNAADAGGEPGPEGP